jgi:hypothetical protein
MSAAGKRALWLGVRGAALSEYAVHFSAGGVADAAGCNFSIGGSRGNALFKTEDVQCFILILLGASPKLWLACGGINVVFPGAYEAPSVRASVNLTDAALRGTRLVGATFSLFATADREVRGRRTLFDRASFPRLGLKGEIAREGSKKGWERILWTGVRCSGFCAEFQIRKRSPK